VADSVDADGRKALSDPRLANADEQSGEVGSLEDASPRVMGGRVEEDPHGSARPREFRKRETIEQSCSSGGA
jgi:hypothetical protein